MYIFCYNLYELIVVLSAFCVTGAHSNSHEDTLTSHHNTHSLRLILAVLLGIVIGVLAGLILLTVVYYCYKK